MQEQAQQYAFTIVAMEGKLLKMLEKTKAIQSENQSLQERLDDVVTTSVKEADGTTSHYNYIAISRYLWKLHSYSGLLFHKPMQVFPFFACSLYVLLSLLRCCHSLHALCCFCSYVLLSRCCHSLYSLCVAQVLLSASVAMCCCHSLHALCCCSYVVVFAQVLHALCFCSYVLLSLLRCFHPVSVAMCCCLCSGVTILFP